VRDFDQLGKRGCERALRVIQGDHFYGQTTANRDLIKVVVTISTVVVKTSNVFLDKVRIIINIIAICSCLRSFLFLLFFMIIMNTYQIVRYIEISTFLSFSLLA